MTFASFSVFFASLLLSGGTHGTAPEELSSALKNGPRLSENYRLGEPGPDDGCTIRFSITGPENGKVTVRLMKRDDGMPAFTRTEHCDILIDWGGSEGAPTPEELGEAVLELTKRIKPSADGKCAQLSARSSTGCISGAPSQMLEEDRFIYYATYFLLAATCLIIFLCSYFSIPESGRFRKYAWLGWLAAVVAFGLALRAFRLDLPFSDGLEAERIQFGDHPMVGLLLGIFRSKRHPPLTYLLINTMLAFGNAEWLLRLPFVVSGTASIAITGYLGKRLGGPWAGIMAALCCAVCAPLIDASRYLASHGLFLATLPLVGLVYLRLCESPTPGRIRALAIVNALSMWTHYLTVVPLLLQAADWLLQKRKKQPLSKALGKSLLLTVLLSFLPIFYMVAGFLNDIQSKKIDRQAHDAMLGRITASGIFHDMQSIAGQNFSYLLLFLSLVFLAVVLFGRGRPSVEKYSPFPVSIRALLVGWSIPVAVLVLSFSSWMQGYYAVISLPVVIPLSAAGAMMAADALAEKLHRSNGKGVFRRISKASIKTLGGVAASALVLSAASHLARNNASYLYDRSVRSGVSDAIQEIRSRGPDTIVLLHDSTYAIAAYYLRDGCLHKGMCVDRTCHLIRHRVMLLLSMEDMREADWKDRLMDRFDKIISTQNVWMITGIPLTRWYRRSNIDKEFEKTIAANKSCALKKTFAENVKVYLCGKD
jgi:hypothetical protein